MIQGQYANSILFPRTIKEKLENKNSRRGDFNP